MAPTAPAAAPDNDAAPPMHTIPIADRPRHGTWWNTLMFPLLFNLGILGISSAQVCAVPLLLVPFVGPPVDLAEQGSILALMSARVLTDQ